MDDRLARDSTIFVLSRRFPTMLAFYIDSTDWVRDHEFCGFRPRNSLVRDFFQSVNGPWPQ